MENKIIKLNENGELDLSQIFDKDILSKIDSYEITELIQGVEISITFYDKDGNRVNLK